MSADSPLTILLGLVAVAVAAALVSLLVAGRVVALAIAGAVIAYGVLVWQSARLRRLERSIDRGPDGG